MIPVINEGTSFELEVEFLGPDGSPVSPSSVEYAIDCLTTGASVRDWTPLTPSSVVSIPISVTDNEIIDEANQVEHRMLTVKALYGAGSQITDIFSYNVKNLERI